MLKYVSIELIRRKDVDGNNLEEPEILCGFFKGIKVAVDTETQKTTSHIIIEVDGEDVQMLSLDHHYVLSLERADSQRRWISYPKTSDFDQTTVFEALAKILAEFAEEGWCTADADIIDTSKYKDIPKRLLSSERTPPAARKKAASSVLRPVNKADAKATVGTQGASIPPVGTTQRKVPRTDAPTGRVIAGATQTAGTTVHKPYVAPKPSATFFKRKGRRPSEKAMLTMLGKVIASQEDDYEGYIPEVEGENDPLPAAAYEHKSAKWNQTYGYGALGY